MPKGLFENNNTQLTMKNVPKTLIALYFFMFFCFGYDFGFLKFLDKKNQLFAKCASIFTFAFITAILLVPIVYVRDVFESYWYTVVMLQNIINFCVLNFSKYNLYELIGDLLQITADVNGLKSELLGIFLFAYSVLIYAGQYIIGCIRCSDKLADVEHNCVDAFGAISFTLYGLALFGNNVINVTSILIFYLISFYVRKIKTIAQASFVTQRKVQIYYLNLTECYDKIKPLYNRLLIVGLIFEVPCLMAMVYHMLYYIHLQEEWIAYIAEAVFSAPICFHILMPAIAKEMLNSQVEDFKLVLNKMILKEKDEEKVKEIQKTLQFVCAHPMHHNAWRFVPVDLRLPLGIFSLCVSYLIVIIQFTHLLD